MSSLFHPTSRQRLCVFSRSLRLGVLTGALLLGSTLATHASCYRDKDSTISGRHNFFTKDNEGQLAWYKSGKKNQLHLVGKQSNNCYTIYTPRSGSIKFIANNVTEKIEDEETYAFLGVQIIRVLKTSKGRDTIRVMRKGQWRNTQGKNIGGFGSQTVPAMDWSIFSDLHESIPFDPASIRLRRNKIWHATPVGGVLSSFDYPRAWIREFANEREVDLLVTNKLIRFQLNSGGGRIGIPFDVETQAAKEVYVSVFSPERDAFTHFVKIIPGN